MKVRILAVSLLAIGCVIKPRVNPINEINQPVFFSGHYMSVGATVGSQAHNNELDSNYHFGPLVEPWFAVSGNVNSWSSYLFWPLLWNFLLSGEQYSTARVLKTGKMHVAAFGGINSLAYSPRDEWQFGVGTGIRAKILYSPRIYSEIAAALQLSDFRSFKRGYLSTQLFYGFQFSPKNSISLDWASTLYKIEERRYFGNHGLAFYNDDVNNEIRARFRTYFTSNHIFGPEIGYGLLNLRAGRDDYYLLGVTYRYVWR